MLQVSANAYWKSQNARNATPVPSVRVRHALEEEPMVSNEAISMAEHEGKADCVEEQPAQANMSTMPSKRTLTDSRVRAKPTIKEHESRLHEEDEERRDDRPHRIDRIDVRRRRRGRRRCCTSSARAG